MEIGEEIIIGRLGQQPMHIADPSVDPQHATLRRTGEDTYQIEDRDSQKGVQVFGFRVKRKTIKAETPLFLGSYKTSVRQLLHKIHVCLIVCGTQKKQPRRSKTAFLLQ